MPTLNRRHFLQAASAAGLAPALPAFPAGAAAATKTVKTSQMLWAGLIARAGNVPNAASLTRTMGISGAAAQRVYAKLVETNMISAYGASTVARAAHPAATSLNASAPANPFNTRSVRANLERLLADAPAADQSTPDQTTPDQTADDAEHVDLDPSETPQAPDH